MPRNDTGLEKLSESPDAVVALNDGTVASRLSVASAVLPVRLNCSPLITSTGTGEAVTERGCCRRDPRTTTSSRVVKPSSCADAPGASSIDAKMLAKTNRHVKNFVRMSATPRCQKRQTRLEHKTITRQCKRRLQQFSSATSASPGRRVRRKDNRSNAPCQAVRRLTSIRILDTHPLSIRSSLRSQARSKNQDKDQIRLQSVNW